MRNRRLGMLVGVALSLWLVTECQAARSDAPKTAGIRAIIAVDEVKGPAGASVGALRLKYALQWMQSHRIPVEITTIPAEELSPTAIITAIRALNAANLENRTLFFYYAGHGATDVKGGTGHFLRTARGDLSRSMLVGEIRAKSPALAILVTDCCSVEGKMDGPGPVIPVCSEVKAAENLFLQHRGLVDLNSSTFDRKSGLGQAAFYHPRAGGLFTQAFTSMLLPDPAFLDGSKPGPIWRFDADGDGFLEWSEAMEHLRAETTRGFEDLRSEVTEGQLRLLAAPSDVRLLLSQVGQDPQIFGKIAERSDRRAKAEQPRSLPEVSKKVRLGAYFQDRVSWGGGSVALIKVDPGSPATKAFESKGGKKAGRAAALPKGLIVTRANNHRVRNRGELFRVMETIPPGGDLYVSGFLEDGGRRTSYEATIVLDRFE